MQAARQIEAGNQAPGGLRTTASPAGRKPMEARVHCAYNQTRECFLGLEVAVADFAYTALAERMQSLALSSGEGLWIAPFPGLPAAGVQAPLDLIYLDERNCVLDVVESFPDLSGQLVEPRAGECSGTAGSFHLLLADPGRRSVGFVRSRRDGGQPGGSGQRQKHGHRAERRAAARRAAVERRAGDRGV